MKKPTLIILAFLGLLATTPHNGHAAFAFTLQQVGTSVVATGSGTLNLTALTLVGTTAASARIQPNDAILLGGPAAGGTFPYYVGATLTGPSSFGTGSYTYASAGTGDFVAIQGYTAGATYSDYLFVPQGYVSGAALSDTATFNNATFASLGFTLGTYTWT